MARAGVVSHTDSACFAFCKSLFGMIDYFFRVRCENECPEKNRWGESAAAAAIIKVA